METAMKTTSSHNWDHNVVLSVEHLTMRFGGLVAVNDLSFNVGRGDITALIGPNGAGKTTVFNCVTGFYKPTEGRIVMRHGAGFQADRIEALTRTGRQFDDSGDDRVFLLERMPDFEISKRAKVARTFQNIRLFGGMTALENLLVAQHNPLMIASSMTIGGIFKPAGLPQGTRRGRIDFAAYWLEKTGLIDRADDPCGGPALWRTAAPRDCPRPCASGAASFCALMNRRQVSIRGNRPNSTNCCNISARTMTPRSC